MAFSNFPYTDFHNLNLDWTLETTKDLNTSGMIITSNGINGSKMYKTTLIILIISVLLTHTLTD